MTILGLMLLESGLSTQGLLIDTTALAAVATLAYLFGRRLRPSAPTTDAKFRESLQRAQRIADDLRALSSQASVEIATHSRSVAAFQSELAAMKSGAADAQWPLLCESADQLLGPTLKLSTNLYLACDQLRRQQTQLSTFSGSRIDPATGLHNRRSLEEQLDAFFSMYATGKRRFALAIFNVSPANADEPKSGEARLRLVARLLEECIRDDDLVARYSEDEFVVLMPQTALAGALAFSERLLVRASADLGCAVCGGVVEAAPGESPSKLLSRADSALYSARAAGGATLFQHNGVGVRRHIVDLQAATQDVAAPEAAEIAGTGSF